MLITVEEQTGNCNRSTEVVLESGGQTGKECQHCLTLEVTKWPTVGMETGEKLGTHVT